MMDNILNWMKGFLIIYLILTILTSLAASDQYKKHLHFFSGVVLLLIYISPILSLFGEAGKLESLISYEAFWEKLDSARQDTQKLEFLQNSHYISKYEQAVAEEMEEQARQQQLPVSRIQVELSEQYEIRQVTVWLDVLQGSEKAEKAVSAAEEEDKLLRLFTETYGLKKEQVSIQGFGQ